MAQSKSLLPVPSPIRCLRLGRSFRDLRRPLNSYASSFTLSPVYPAAQQLLGERGVSLRFPRFIKIRDDKALEQATSSEQLASMYEKQSEGGGGAKKEEDFA